MGLKVIRCPACGRREKRSSEANRRYWAIVTAVAQKVKPQGVAYEITPWHTWFKSKFIGCEDIRLPNGAVITQPLSSSDLDPPEFSDYMTAVEAWAGEHGVWLDE